MNATPIVRRPLVGVAISVAAGLFFHNNYGGSPLLLLGLSAVLLSLCCWMIFRRNTAGLLYLCCATLASAYSAIESLPSAATNTFMVAEHRYSELDIQGTIADDPVTYESNSTVSFLLKAQLLLNENQHLPINTLVRVYAKAGSDTIQFGEQWRFCGRLTRYKKPRGGAEGSFRVTDAKGWKIKEASPSLLGYCYALRRDAAAILRSGVEPFLEQTRLIHAMLLGYRQAIPSDLYLLFTRTGTLHIFAISGQHAVMLAAIFIAGLKLIGIPRPRWGLLLIPSLFLYIFTTGLQPSALRALAMATIFFIAPFVKRRPDIPSSMAVAALLILMMNPANINDPGFLLSFVIVSGLILVHSWATHQWAAFSLKNWESPLTQLQGSRPFAKFMRTTALLLLSSIAAWLFSTPISAWFFNSISMAALPGNVVVIPLTFMIMLTGCLATLTGTLCLSIAALFNQANLFFIGLLIWIVRRLSDIPWASLIAQSPSILVIGLWYTGLLMFLTGPLRWRKGALVLSGLSILFWCGAHIPLDQDLHILRDPASDSILLRMPQDRWTLVTSGSSLDTPTAIRFVQKEGVNQLHALVLRNTRVDTNALHRLQATFDPESIQPLDEKGASWSIGQGAVQFSTR